MASSVTVVFWMDGKLENPVRTEKLFPELNGSAFLQRSSDDYLSNWRLF